MTKRVSILPATLVGALAVAVALGAPVFAQESAPAPVRAPAASIKLDFGAGRRVRIDCGEAALQACLETAKPVIDQVASTPVAKERMGRHHRKGWKKGGAGAGDGAGAGAAAPAAEDSATSP